METFENLETPAAESDGWEYAVVEIFGHRKHAGRTREEERFGAKMLRIDVPSVSKGEDGSLKADGWTTHFYGGSSIFSYSLTDEASVLRANKPYDPPARLSYQYEDEADGGEE